jgi:hypothetical protein
MTILITALFFTIFGALLSHFSKTLFDRKQIIERLTGGNLYVVVAETTRLVRGESELEARLCARLELGKQTDFDCLEVHMMEE